MADEGPKQLATFIDGPVKDALKRQTLERGQIQARAVNAALAIWVLLPEDLQASIIRHAPEDYAEPVGGDNLFSDVNVRKAWEALRERAGLPHVTRQDLRVTFSTLLQRIGAEHSTVRLLEHSDPRVTQTWYTDNEVMDKLRVNLLPVEDWLSA